MRLKYFEAILYFFLSSNTLFFQALSQVHVSRAEGESLAVSKRDVTDEDDVDFEDFEERGSKYRT